VRLELEKEQLDALTELDVSLKQKWNASPFVFGCKKLGFVEVILLIM
jgi:hypothetical protein